MPSFQKDATLKGFASTSADSQAQLFQSCEESLGGVFEPRVAKAQPWAEISQRFQRYSFR
jgi:hypothetical protein